MSSPRKLSLSIWTIAAAFLVIGGLALGIARFSKHDAAPRVMASENAPSHQQEPQNETTPIQVVHPKKGFLERLSTQPGSIQAYESIRLFAKVPGFLKEQKVDIGDRVKKGDVLAVVDVPELQAQRKRNRAAIRQAGARVLQMKARVSSAMADLDAANAGVTKAIASQKSAAAWVRYRKMQLQRMSDLFVIKSIEERLVDESKEHYEASVETELAAQENVTAAKAIVVASQAKIAQAKADVDEAKA